MERLEMVDGRVYRGYIESEDDLWVHMALLERFSNTPTHLVVIRPIEKARIRSIVRLSQEERGKLEQRLDKLIHRARIEAGRENAIGLKRIEQDGSVCYTYRGHWFTLQSNADETITRRAIVRIEQTFTGYRQVLPPRVPPSSSLRIVVLDSMEAYHGVLGQYRIRIDNPACFIPKENVVVAGSELARFYAQLAEVDSRHRKLHDELTSLETALENRLTEMSKQLLAEGTPRDAIARMLAHERTRYERALEKKRNELAVSDRVNTAKLARVTSQMFRRLDHEAFHAYLENFVFPHDQYSVPPWLNEGLALMFENARSEPGTLRLDSPNRNALSRLQEDLKGPSPLRLATVLSADSREFVAERDAQRLYAYSWGMAYCLTFGKRLLNGESLEHYVRREGSESRIARFEKLVGMSLDEFERRWRQYILQLR